MKKIIFLLVTGLLLVTSQLAQAISPRDWAKMEASYQGTEPQKEAIREFAKHIGGSWRIKALKFMADHGIAQTAAEEAAPSVAHRGASAADHAAELKAAREEAAKHHAALAASQAQANEHAAKVVALQEELKAAKEEVGHHAVADKETQSESPAEIKKQVNAEIEQQAKQAAAKRAADEAAAKKAADEAVAKKAADEAAAKRAAEQVIIEQAAAKKAADEAAAKQAAAPAAVVADPKIATLDTAQGLKDYYELLRIKDPSQKDAQWKANVQALIAQMEIVKEKPGLFPAAKTGIGNQIKNLNRWFNS